MTATVQLFEASSGYHVLVLVAALDSGAFPPAERRILLFSSNGEVPEVARRLDADPAFARLLARFDDVVHYNDLIFPLHPSVFRPRAEEQVLYQRAFRRELGVADDQAVELVLESVHVPPGRTLLNVFADSPATVYAEGLMSYGPTRDALNGTMVARIDRVLYLDLVAGVTPILLSEYGVPAEPIDEAAFRAAVRELPDPVLVPDEPYGLVLGQYLAPLGLLSAKAEARLYGDLVEVAARHGLKTVVFKPHPSAPVAHLETLRRRADTAHVRLLVDTSGQPAEVLYDRARPRLVLGCFSTGLVTAARYWGIATGSLGTGEVLAALPRVEDSNRIPLVLVDRTVQRATGEGPDPVVARRGSNDGLQALLETVAYCMQWRARRGSRAAAAEFLRRHGSLVERYVPRARLRLLSLPGGWPVELSPAGFDAVQEARASLGGVERLVRRAASGFRALGPASRADAGLRR